MEADIAALQRAVWIALGASVMVALVGTILLYRARSWTLRHTSLPLVTNVVATLAFLAIFVLSASLLTTLTNYQINQREPSSDIYITTSHVHFGVWFKMLPLVPMFATWLFLLAAQRRHARTAV